MRDQRRLVWQHMKVHGRLLLAAYGFALAAVGAGLLVPWALQLLIDYVLPGRALPGVLAGLSGGWSPAVLVGALGVAVILIAGAEAWMTSQQHIHTARVREGFTRDIRVHVLQHLFVLPPFTDTNHRSGELFTRLVSDVNIVARLLTKTGPLLIRYVSTAVLMLIIVVWIAPVAAVLTAVALIPLGVGARAHGRKLTEAMRRKRAADGDVAGLAQEIIAGLTTVQAQGRTAAVTTRFAGVNAKSAGAGVTATTTAAQMERSLKIGQGATLGLLMGFGGLLVLTGQVTIGELTVILAYASQLLKPIEKVNDVATAVAGGVAAGERLSQLLDRAPAVTEPANPTPLIHCQGIIKVENVSFRYPSNPDTSDVLRHLDMYVPPRTLTVVAGRSGSGKSTLLHLLVRIFDPDDGVISLDGIPLHQLRLQDLRRHVYVVRQQAHLFGGTWRDILCDGDDIPDDKLWEALAKVALDDRVRAASRQLDASISENAVNLSGGERQRIAIARALLRPCSVLLLDEPLAHVDAKSEAIIIEAIAQLSETRTCLVTSHRQSILRRAELVYWLENGRVTRHPYGAAAPTLAASGF